MSEFLKEAVKGRDAEIANYQVNIDNYTRMLANLTFEWCEKTLPYRGKTIKDIACEIDNDAFRTLVADLLFKDNLTVLLRCEKLEQRKAIMVRQVLMDQLEGK